MLPDVLAEPQGTMNVCMSEVVLTLSFHGDEKGYDRACRNMPGVGPSADGFHLAALTSTANLKTFAPLQP